MRIDCPVRQGGMRKYSSGVGTGTMRMGVRMPAFWNESTVNWPPTIIRSHWWAVSTQLLDGLPSKT